MAKKGAQVQFYAEVNTDDEWERLLDRDGLIVVDIYSEWAGPVSSMQALLKKIKVEKGGDTLVLAIAKSDHIKALERFRGKSEPTWMLISKRKMVTLMYGANAPKLQQLILDELKNEEEKLEREGAREISELADEEKVRFDAKESVLQKVREHERQKKAKELHARRVQELKHLVELVEEKMGIILVFPQAIHVYKEVLNDHISEASLIVKENKKILLNEEMLEELFYFYEEERFDEETIAELEQECMILLLQPARNKTIEGTMEETLLSVVYGEMQHPPGSHDSPADLIRQALETMEEEKQKEEKEETQKKNLIGVWVPKNEELRAVSIKIFYPEKVAEGIVPEPPPIPEHIAIIFEDSKIDEAFEIIEKWPDEIMRFGFFTSEDPDNTKLVAKSRGRFEHQSTHRNNTEKLVLQVAQRKSECIFDFATLGPMEMSPNTKEGSRVCKLFFSEDYDEETDEPEEEEVVIEEKSSKTSKKSSRMSKKSAGGEIAEDGEILEHPPEDMEEVIHEEGAEDVERVVEESEETEEIQEGGGDVDEAAENKEEVVPENVEEAV